MSSAVALAISLYSASVLEGEPVGCFRDPQEIRLPPKKIVKPPMLGQSLGLPAQSTSEKALNREDEDLLKQSPRSIVAQSYRRIRFTAAQ
jgi:hypothetical protein